MSAETAARVSPDFVAGYEAGWRAALEQLRDEYRRIEATAEIRQTLDVVSATMVSATRILGEGRQP